MGSGIALTHLTNGRFTPHHTLVYTINAFFGPDIGSFTDWLSSFFPSSSFVSDITGAVHHPFYYVLILGFPLCFFYSTVSRILLQRGILNSISGVQLSKRQCILLISAGSLSHFFLDHLFEDNGHTSMYTWILSTGWWINRAPIDPDAVIVVGFLCTLLLLGFIYINRVRPVTITSNQSLQSIKLVLVIASLYCLWCARQIYWVDPRRPAVGEEADLGVIFFMSIYFFLPHCFLILSKNPEVLHLEMEHHPLHIV